MNRRIFFAWMGLSWLASTFPKLLGPAIAQTQTPGGSGNGNSEATVFYVAPNGRDSWSGKLAEPNGKDGPFATLLGARDALRQLKRQQGSTLDRPVIVSVRGGTYFLDQPLVLNSRDSGTQDAPITYAAYNNEKPIISGGRRIGGWQEENVNGRTLWTVTLPEVQSKKWFFQQLWVNGQRRNRARYPSQGYLQVKSAPAKKQWNQGVRIFRYKEEDLQAWPSVKTGQVEVVVMNRWAESRLPISEIDESRQTISFSKQSLFSLQPGDKYYIDNIFEELDTPGEWYLNQSTGKLYYLPVSGEAINTAEVIAPVLENIILFQGKPQANQYVDYINFQGLTFSHTDWKLPPNISGFIQNAFGVPGAIYGNGCRFCRWENCTFSHLGTYAIELMRGCQNNRVAECEMVDLGAGGIKIGERETRLLDISDSEESNYNEITNNHIYSAGRFFPSAVGIRIQHSNNNRIAYNHVHDLYYTGIAARGTWGYKQTPAHHNVIESNYVHHIGKLSNGEGLILSDMAGVYTLGVQEGTVVRANIIHDINAAKYGGHGIYFDEASSYIVAEKNLIFLTSHGGFYQNYGKENIVRNNIFAFGQEAQIRRKREEDHMSFRFENNIVYWQNGNLLAGNWSDFNYVFERNLYWRADEGEIRFANLSFEQWQQKGMDENSMIASPQFVAPERGDFRLKPDSPALKLGFEPLPDSRTARV